MRVPPLYSICTTSYNSASTAEDFLRPLLQLGPEYEVVVVDNQSSDDTMQILNDYGSQVMGINLKCSRGLGRQVAMEKSNGEIILHVEFDVGYTGISKAIEFFNKSKKDKIYYFIIEGQQCNASLYIGRRELYQKAGGFPDLNYAEDLYLNKFALSMNILEVVHLPLELNCLEVRGKGSGSEARYEKGIYRQFKRRVLATRDILFVNGIGYRELMNKYKLHGLTAILVGVPEYFLGKLMTFGIRLPKPPDIDPFSNTA